MIIRSDVSMESTIKNAAELTRAKQFKLARKLMSDAGVCYFTIERVLYEPHNIRSTD